MQMIKSVYVAGVAIALASCGGAQPAAELETDRTESPEIEVLGEATLADAEGASIGTVTMRQEGKTISLDLTVEGIGPGEHAFHLHTTGSCDAPDFISAGGHLNPFDKSHGRLNENGKHLGDLPNITIADGASFAETFTFEQDAEKIVPEIFDEDGTAVMIHAGPDDYMTDPAGAAGPRIACGVLTRAE